MPTYSKIDIDRNQAVADRGDLFYIQGSGLYTISGQSILKLGGADEAEYKAMGINIPTLTPEQSDVRFRQLVETYKKYGAKQGFVNEYSGQRVTGETAEAFLGGGQGGSSPDYSAPVTGAFKDSAAYKALSAEEKELIDLAFNINFQGDEKEFQIIADALTKAMALADPYAKAQLAMAKAELGLARAKVASDFTSAKDILERTRTELAEDLKNSKEFLSLEQQADMARTLQTYDEDLLTIADQAAEKGITFATGARSRALAEERRTDQYQDVIQSDQRKFNFQIQELELRAARGDADAQAQLDKLTADKGFKLQEIGQAAEKVLGSTLTGAESIEGYTPVGGVLGDIEQQRRKSIIDIVSPNIPE